VVIIVRIVLTIHYRKVKDIKVKEYLLRSIRSVASIRFGKRPITFINLSGPYPILMILNTTRQKTQDRTLGRPNVLIFSKMEVFYCSLVSGLIVLPNKGATVVWTPY
jgi:hypothetical protein